MSITKSYSYAVYFDRGFGEPRENELRVVDQGLARWPDCTEHRVALVGTWHSELEDLKLAKARIQVVHDYLLRNGVDQSRIDPSDLQLFNNPIGGEIEKYAIYVNVEFYPPKLRDFSSNRGNSKSF